jgi:crotonobetainyl-CoA:carnitine CoA-transferase CaiB-like acyl-CoA transferase
MHAASEQEDAVTNDFPDGSADTADQRPGPLAGLRVIDAASLFAGPITGTLLADFGADVIKVEHPKGDNQRNMGWQVDGTSLMWTVLNRNKRCVTLDLHDEHGQELFRRLCSTADVVIENFRPGTLERWGIGYEHLAAINPRLVMVRVTAFGQTGPWKDRPGFGTIAEAMSGFAHINGHPDGPPTLPPFALGDAIAGVFGAVSALIALRHRDTSPEGRGQSIDLSIFEPLFWILGPQMSVYDQLGEIQGRTGNRAPFTSPRNLYQSKDGRWIAISASAQSIANRLMRMVGAPEYVDEPWFASHVGRLDHIDELDDVVGRWIGERTTDEVMAESERFEVAAAPIYNIEDIAKDEQYLARETFTRMMDGLDRSIAVQNVVPLLSETPGRHRWLGPALGAHNAEVFRELGCSPSELAELERDGVISSAESLDSGIPVGSTTETGSGI